MIYRVNLSTNMGGKPFAFYEVATLKLAHDKQEQLQQRHKGLCVTIERALT